ncbi:MAG: methylated-DNA--[protein]-cysteine S-methyltransferase [Pseudomonadota bacterium]
MMDTQIFARLETPIGPLLLAGAPPRLRVIAFPQEDGEAAAPPDDWVREDDAFITAQTQLTEYFDGRRTAFDLDLDPRGTPFQKKVWARLPEVPFGETATYGEIAKAIGAPKASRAVGAANGRNPLPIVVPCHRIIGSGGALTGFAGGLPLKRRLLALEARVFGERRPPAASAATPPLQRELGLD